jgi:mono/diheme cytochrome c family protein
MAKKYFLVMLMVSVTLVACKSYLKVSFPDMSEKPKPVEIPASSQIPSGNAQKGYDYMVNGDFIGSGIPLELYKTLREGFVDTVLHREAPGKYVPYEENAFVAANGQTVVSGNCFACHASRLNGKMVLGLGRVNSDFTRNFSLLVKLLRTKVRTTYKKDTPEWEAFENLTLYQQAIASKIRTDITGVNTAFRLEEACAMQRNPVDLTYRKEPIHEMNKFNIGSDIPPLWNMKKKNALYYNGMGRGDFTKLLMQASVLGIEDSAAARQAHGNFTDVKAWIESLDPPEYPKEINQRLAKRGKNVYTITCKKCHGTYGEEETYPNLLVSLQEVETDPYYALYFTQQSHLAEWYNQSWFANSYPQSSLKPSEGYVAPPLDGIWASAPYLHNGSVPTLEDLLNSPQRPDYWVRSGNSDDFDYEKVGWNYRVEKDRKAQFVYDTTIPGYGNQGHTFGDHLSDQERKALVEYLKTL